MAATKTETASMTLSQYAETQPSMKELQQFMQLLLAQLQPSTPVSATVYSDWYGSIMVEKKHGKLDVSINRVNLPPTETIAETWLLFLAPEIIFSNTSCVDENFPIDKADAWTVGCVAVDILNTGILPSLVAERSVDSSVFTFKLMTKNNSNSVFKRLQEFYHTYKEDDEFQVGPRIPEKHRGKPLPWVCQMFLKRCLRVNSSNRASIAELLMDDFIKVPVDQWTERVPPVPDEYVLSKLLNTRGHCQTYMALQNRREVAIKRITLSLDPNSRSAEIAYLHKAYEIVVRVGKLYPNTNIVQHYGCKYEDPKNLTTPPFYDVCMEFCRGGTLFKAAEELHPAGVICRAWLKQVLQGAEFLHGQQITHRALDAGKIFFFYPIDVISLGVGNVLKIGGFQYIREFPGHSKNQVSEVKHKSRYRAPEVIAGTTNPFDYIGRKADIWSFGCIAIQTFTGRNPEFYRDSKPIEKETAVAYYVGSQGGLPVIPKHIPATAQRMIEVCLKINSKDRPTAEQLLKHDFFRVPDADLNFSRT